MRIISGAYKGKAIKQPLGIRPTQNKVRKALFDILGDIQGLSFLELFAGSGAVGFEAASRGAKGLALVEDNRACQLAINKNIAALGLTNCRLYSKEAIAAIKALHKEQRRFEIIFFDPPYYSDVGKKTLQTLEAYDILAPNGFIIAQHFKKDVLPEPLGDLILFKQSHYGDTVLSFYRKG
ncbi:MAG: 16S rRNA (guanine(966)-N(2))-methyltransferase RsmD [Candidatus Omnitrophota bacterium]